MFEFIKVLYENAWLEFPISCLTSRLKLGPAT
jgi:hypothetical protein